MFQGGNYHGRKKKKASAYREPLIPIAFVILGAIIGMMMGEKASFLYPIGQIWLNLLFVLLVPLLSSQFPVLLLISAIQKALESC